MLPDLFAIVFSNVATIHEHDTEAACLNHIYIYIYIYISVEPPEVRKHLVILEPISGTSLFHILKPTVLLAHSKVLHSTTPQFER